MRVLKMNTYRHSTRAGDCRLLFFLSSVIPRLLRLAKGQGLASLSFFFLFFFLSPFFHVGDEVRQDNGGTAGRPFSLPSPFAPEKMLSIGHVSPKFVMRIFLRSLLPFFAFSSFCP